MDIKTTAIESLDQLANGAATERFAAGMAALLENVFDLNTDPKKARVLTLKVTVKPDETRENAKLSIATALTLAPQVPVEVPIMIGQDGNKVVASEITRQIPGQIDMDGKTTEQKATVFQMMK